MYNPQKYKSSEIQEAFDLMDKNPFATILTVMNGEPFVSHLPITPKKTEDSIELIGHLARANPQWRFFAQSTVTVIFQGPHTYITPKWYVENDVPTWNYSTVHVKGQVELIESYNGILDCLKDLTSHVERHWPSGWDFFVPDDLQGEDLTKHIVGFRVQVKDINFKKKLSQNRTPADRAGVLRGLETRADENSRLVLVDMLKLYQENGETK